MTVIDLATRRIDRLEKAQRETNERLGRIEDSLGRVVTVLEVHTRHFERLEDAIYGVAEHVDRVAEHVDRVADRVDRLSVAIARGRTQDLERFVRIERRLNVLERRPQRRRKRRRADA